MNIIKKYWDSVYIYILLIVPGLCMCAGTYWTIRKKLGFYESIPWAKIVIFDCSQLVYLAIAIFFIYRNWKDSSYIAERLIYVKTYIVVILFIQYNFILYLFASNYVWECTFIFFSCIAFMFDSKLMLFNIVLYSGSLIVAHVLKPEEFLPLEQSDIQEIIAYRILMIVVTSICFIIIVYLVERFLIQAQESDEENVRLMGNQLEYYRDMELMDSEIRKFRHDIKNHFICMEWLVNNGKMDELQTYFQDLQQSFSVEGNVYFSGNDIVDTILHHYLPHHCRKEVKVSVCGTLPEIKSVSAMDLCTIFSNLLSNAVTSANRCVEDGASEIIIRFSGGSRYFSIEISNSICGQQLIKKEKKRDRNHGYGLNKINSVLEKYGGRFEQKAEQDMMDITIYLPI